MSTRPLTPAQRAAHMRRRREQGWTYRKIAERYGVSKQYVHRVVNGRG